MSAARQAPERRGGPFARLWDRPGYLVRRLHQIHVALFLEECAGSNITPVQFGLLSVLSEGEALDQRALGAKVGIDRTNVADVLARLEAHGLVERSVNPADRRMKLASLTPAGRDFVGRLQASMERAQERLVGPLDAAERRQFLDYLHRLVVANNETGRATLSADLGDGADRGTRPTR